MPRTKETQKANGWLAMNRLAEEFLGVKMEKKSVEVEYNSTKRTLINRMDGQNIVVTDKYTITYFNNPQQRVDIERLKVERPDIYEKFLKPTDHWDLTVRESVPAKTQVA